MQIYLYPHPILRHNCKPLVRVNEFVKDKVKEMLDYLHDNDSAVGLAASQVGFPWPLFVTKIPSCPVVINPSIKASNGTSLHYESCLSIPDVELEVRRANTVQIKGWDLNGDEVNLRLSDFDARVIQHEFDHTIGRLFIEYLPRRKLEKTNTFDVLVKLKKQFEKSGFDSLQWKETLLERELLFCQH